MHSFWPCSTTHSLWATEGRQEDVDDSDEEYTNDDKVIERLGTLLLMSLVDVVAAVEDEKDTNQNLKRDGEGDTGDSQRIESVGLSPLVEEVLQLGSICGKQSNVHHALGDTFLGGVQVDVHDSHPLASAARIGDHREPRFVKPPISIFWTALRKGMQCSYASPSQQKPVAMF